MATTATQGETRAYSQAAGTGKYDRPSGLLGKYDNVRRLWEDPLTGLFLRPALNALAAERKAAGKKLRILDLGCGSGDGFDLVMGVTETDPGIDGEVETAIPDPMLDRYVGLDLNSDLLRQADEYYGRNPKVSFLQGDLGHGLPKNAAALEPFDLYLTTFGTLSHFSDEQNIRLISEILGHANDGAVFVGDWLGRYSYEWQTLWDANPEKEYFMDYRISYIYPEEERAKVHIPGFPLRLMHWPEIRRIVEEAARQADVQVGTLRHFDRSVFVGRHLDTAEYNPHAPQLRAAVNSLFESGVRTDLETLLVDYAPRPGFDELNRYFESFFGACNSLVEYTARLIRGYDPETRTCRDAPPIEEDYPPPLKRAMQAMLRIVEGTAWVRWGDVRANVIEPQLGYCLRELEMSAQEGLGTGHGLIGVFEVRKQNEC